MGRQGRNAHENGYGEHAEPESDLTHRGLLIDRIFSQSTRAS
jgi:hypothetical protein